MRVKMELKAALPIKVTYNGETIFEKTLEPGKHDIKVETPQVTGEAKLFYVIDGVEKHVATATYTFDQKPQDGEKACGCNCGDKQDDTSKAG